MKKSEFTFEGKGGLKLFARSWRPSTDVRAVMVVVHGFKAHSGLYEWPAEELAEEGIAVYAMDLRGNGKSEGERYYVESFSDFQEDLDRFVARVRKDEPTVPMFLLGHSAGGVISCAYALAHQDKLAGFVCESFAYKVGVPSFAFGVLRGVDHVAPHVGLLNLKDVNFSRDTAFVERMMADPLVVHTSGPVHTVVQMQTGNDMLAENFVNMKMPILILHGTEDKVTLPVGSQEFFDNAGSADKTLKLYEGHFHDLFNDLEREVVMGDVLGWIDAHIARGRAATA